jgi:hypothetical protein
MTERNLTSQSMSWLSYLVGRFSGDPHWPVLGDPRGTTNALGGEVVLDFMFWPSSKRRFGWFLEPGYDYSFARGHERSIGISGGLLIAIPRRR